MQTFAYDYGTYYQVIVTDGTEQNSLTFEFTKEQDLNTSIQVAQQNFNFYVSQQNVTPISV